MPFLTSLAGSTCSRSTRTTSCIRPQSRSWPPRSTADPDAVFAYPILEVHEDGLPITLLGYQPWEPAQLRVRNYIDALALIRRRDAIALGGYTEDLRLYGWEDYDLWCRVADRGRYGVHVPEILARYARAEHSMISLTAIDTAEAMAVAPPSLPEPVRTPQAAAERTRNSLTHVIG